MEEGVTTMRNDEVVERHLWRLYYFYWDKNMNLYDFVLITFWAGAAGGIVWKHGWLVFGDISSSALWGMLWVGGGWLGILILERLFGLWTPG